MLQLLPSCTQMVTTERWTLLVVENEPMLRELMRRMLEKLDYKVMVADNGNAAVEIAEHAEGIDLLLTDVVMPGMDGFEVADCLTLMHPHVRVLYLSGYSTESPHVGDRLKSHPGALLQKPFTQAALVAQVKALLGAPYLHLV